MKKQYHATPEQIAESKRNFRNLIKDTKLCERCLRAIPKDHYGNQWCSKCEQFLDKARREL